MSSLTLPPCQQWQPGELSQMSSEQERWPCLSPATALERAGPILHLGITVELGVGDASEPDQGQECRRASSAFCLLSDVALLPSLILCHLLQGGELAPGSCENWPCPTLRRAGTAPCLGSRVELALVVEAAGKPALRTCNKRADRLITSDTSQAQTQGFELAHSNTDDGNLPWNA